ncbi:MAG: DinB family protein [Anaerolineales bacterium]|jgi:hypothetical protein
MSEGSAVQTLADKITAEGEKTNQFFAALPEDIWEQKCYTDGEEWNVHEVLAHIVDTEDSLRRFFEFIVAEGSGVGEDFDIDRYNAGAVKKLRETGRAELMGMFCQRRERVVSFVRGLAEADLQREGRHPFLGHAALGEMLRLYYLHVNLHIRDIRKIMR